MVLSSLAPVFSSCGFDDDDEPEEIVDSDEGGDDEGLPAEVRVTLSAPSVCFGMDGGTAVIGIDADGPVYLERPPQNGDDELEELPSTSVEEYQALFYEEETAVLVYKAELRDTSLTVSVEAATTRCMQQSRLPLYDSRGREVASLSISREGNPCAPAVLTGTGRALVAAALKSTSDMLSTMRQRETEYLAGDAGFHAPLSPSDNQVESAYKLCYQQIARVENPARILLGRGLKAEAAFFGLMSVIGYNEVADKWGNAALVPHDNIGGDIKQLPADSLLLHQLRTLEAASLTALGNSVLYRFPATAEAALEITSDVVDCALADVCMLLGDYARCAGKLEGIVSRGAYRLGQSPDAVEEVIFGLHVSEGDSRQSVYSLPGVMADYAECLVHMGETGRAADVIRALVAGKSLPVDLSGLDRGTKHDCIQAIAEIRALLSMPRTMAFMRRNTLPGFKPWQYRWPIPESELARCMAWVQNPGYN